MEEDEKDRILRLCKERYGAILDETPVGVCITNEDGIYEYVNSAYTRIYGYSEEELLGSHFTMVVPPENRETMMDLHNKFLGRKYELSGEWNVVSKDGSVLTILANAAYMLDVDEKPKKVTFVIDISERKKTERQLAETVEQLKKEIEERKRLEKAREQMERMVRHDMKNPLNGILGVSQLLLQEDLPENQSDLVSMLYDSGRQLLSMIENFVDYQKMEEGVYRLQPEEFELCSFFTRLCKEVGEAFKLDKIHMLCRYNGTPIEELGEVKRFFYGEPLHLKTVFENLIRNAYEASVEGDTISVDMSFDEKLHMEFHNRAPIPEEIRGNFFQRYVTYGKERGTGMGTYIAKMIVEYHGGTIGFTSDEEKGTTVCVDIPRTKPNAVV